MLKRLMQFLMPPPQWRLAVIVVLGIGVGVAAFVLHVSKATSYLSENPATCINCHVMVPQYANWQHSSHARTATCTDCHVPHDNIFHKYAFKAQDGLRHATIFTLRREPQVIHIKPAGLKAVQDNCLRCHSEILDDVSIHQAHYEDIQKGDQKFCWECHREVPHGRVRSLSSVPYMELPGTSSVVAPWLEKILPENIQIKNGGAYEKNN